MRKKAENIQSALNGTLSLDQDSGINTSPLMAYIAKFVCFALSY